MLSWWREARVSGKPLRVACGAEDCAGAVYGESNWRWV